MVNRLSRLLILGIISGPVFGQFFGPRGASIVRQAAQIKAAESEVEPSVLSDSESPSLSGNTALRNEPSPTRLRFQPSLRKESPNIQSDSQPRSSSSDVQTTNSRTDSVPNIRPLSSNLDSSNVRTLPNIRSGITNVRPSSRGQSDDGNVRNVQSQSVSGLRDGSVTKSGESIVESRFNPSNDRQSISSSQDSGNSGNSNREELFAPRGNARTFSPEQNPITEQRRTKLQAIQNSPEFQESAKLPLSQDFLPSCPDATFSYIIPSPSQCDLYYLCEYGTPSKQLCEDGLVFSIEEVKCVAAHKEDCKDRPLLQTPLGTGPCQRKNGIFYTNQTCNEFVTCRDNTPSFERCATGLVFDPEQKICAWADEALRPGCLPEDLLGFRCPNPKLSQEEALLARVHLRFGDHDRFPDTSDCRFFFMCLRTGQPRRAGCSNGKVFDRTTGICKLAKDVPECVDYYGPVASPDTGVSIASDRLRVIEDDIQKQFEGIRRQRAQIRLKRWILEEAEPEPWR